MKPSQLAAILTLLSLTLVAFSFVSPGVDYSRITATPSVTPQKGPMPVFVWLVFDPWKMVLGSDSPRLVLYDDHQIIYFNEDDETYLSARLSDTESAEFVAALADFSTLDESYEASGWTDQPSHRMFFWQDGDMKSVYVYGDPSLDDVRENLPETFLHIYDTVAGYENPDAKSWLPEYIEVMIWPYDTSARDAAQWPADWPGLDDPTTVERYNNLYSLYLSSEKFEDFTTLMKKSSGVAVIGGQTWAVSYRFPFPQEAMWMEAM